MAHLFLIAGHGAGDSGAVGYGYTEAERVRALARRIVAYGGSNVTLGDTNRNWYVDKGISSLKISKDWQILELHMDSNVSTAKGGHVIIKEGYNPDQYDTALANFIASFFPGRANKIVGRAHLANVNLAAAKGYSYRLLENGFITNQGDLNKFNSQIDDLARGILKAFGISSAAPVASVKKKAEPIDGEIKAGGAFQNKTDKFGTISYQAHMRSAGWGAWQSDGLMVGSTNQNRRIEALHIQQRPEQPFIQHIDQQSCNSALCVAAVNILLLHNFSQIHRRRQRCAARARLKGKSVLEKSGTGNDPRGGLRDGDRDGVSRHAGRAGDDSGGVTDGVNSDDIVHIDLRNRPTAERIRHQLVGDDDNFFCVLRIREGITQRAAGRFSAARSPRRRTRLPGICRGPGHACPRPLFSACQ